MLGSNSSPKSCSDFIFLSFSYISSGELSVFLVSFIISFIAATKRPAEPVAKSHTYESLLTLASFTSKFAT